MIRSVRRPERCNEEDSEELVATVLDVREERRDAGGSRWQLLLDRVSDESQTPTLLEAVSRSGTPLRLRVLAAEREETGQRWLVVEKPLAAGTTVRVFTTVPREQSIP